jgi:hypothetical protein
MLLSISNDKRSVDIGEERGRRSFEQKTPHCRNRTDHLRKKHFFQSAILSAEPTNGMPETVDLVETSDNLWDFGQSVIMFLPNESILQSY